MSKWRQQIRARLEPLRLRPEREAEIVEEVAQHLDDRYREMRAAGQDDATAAAVAWRELEAADVLGREVARSERPQLMELPPPGAPTRGRVATALWQDLRFAARSLRKQPVFAITVLTALALSIGPTTAILSVGNWLFWRPLPGLVEADRLAVVWFGRWQNDGVSPSGVSYPNIADLRSGLKGATGFAGVQEQSASLIVGEAVPRVVGSAFVTADFFDVLGVRPMAGRTFVPAEDQAPAGTPVVMISAGLATRSFGSAAAAIDQRVTLNRQAFRVIGVAADGFSGVTTTSNVDVWMTGATFPYLSGRVADGGPQTRGDGIFYMFVARLAPRTDFTQLEAEFDVLGRALVDAHPGENEKFRTATARVFPGLGMEPLSRPRMRTMVNVLLAIGGVLLLLGCANVANMLIARAIRREQEVVVRRALGASGWRLVQLQLTESWLLAAGGAALGLVLAFVLKQVMQTMLFPAGAGVLRAVPMDLRVLGLTMSAALVVGTVAGLAPAWLSTRGRLTGITGSSGMRTTTRAPRLRSGLAVVQLALSLTLLVGALLLVTTLRNLRAVDLGFDPSNLSTFRMDFSSQGYDAPRALGFQKDLLTALGSLPSLSAATIGQRAPFDSSSGIRVLPPGAGPKDVLRVDSNGVAHNYFEVLGTPVLRGRVFSDDEVYAATPIETTPVVLNDALARRLFGEADPVGRTVHMPATANGPARDLPVIGVVRDSHWSSITGAPSLLLFQPLGRYDFGAWRATAIVRSTRPIAEVATALRAAAARLDRNLPLSGGLPLSMQINRGIQQQRLFATMLAWVSALAFVLAAIGLHGLVSQTTAERAREFGIRLAIGASRTDIARLVARYVLVIASLGTVVGLGLAGLGTTLVKAMLFGVTALDPVVYAVAIGAMAVIVILASAWPALRATRVQPVDVLRAE